MNLKDITPKSLTRSIGHFLRRYHLIIFFVITSTIFGAAVLHVQAMLAVTASDETYQSGISAGSIDAATLQRINALHQSEEVTSLPTPPASPRSNPFGE